MSSLPVLGVAQARIFRSSARFITAVAARRFGKTTLIGVRQFHAAISKSYAECRYVAPTYKQAKMIFWEPMKAMIPSAYVLKKNETELSITLVNRSRIMLLGADNPDSLRGPGLDLVDFDEYADVDPRAWEEVIRPTLADREGRAGFFGTPKGFNHFYDLHMRGGVHEGWEAFHFTTAQGGRVRRSEIDQARADLDPRVFRQEFEASFETLKGRVYANFSRAGWPAGNWDRDIRDRGGVLYVGMDFNINPMCAVIIQEHMGWPQVIGELSIPTSNTEEMAATLRAKYPGRRILIAPDASGQAGHTNAPLGQTDLTILRRHGFELVMDKINPGVHDRVNNVQSLLQSGTGQRRLTLHPTQCPLTTKSLEGLTWKDGTNLMDKKSGLDHITDALGYILWQRWNILAGILPSAVPGTGALHSPYGTEV